MKGQRFLDLVQTLGELNVTVLASSAPPKCECESSLAVSVDTLPPYTYCGSCHLPITCPRCGAPTAGECVPDDCLIRAAKIKNRAEMPARVEMMKSVLNTTVEDRSSPLTEEDNNASSTDK